MDKEGIWKAYRLHKVRGVGKYRIYKGMSRMASACAYDLERPIYRTNGKPRGIRTPMDDPERVLTLLSQHNDEWKNAALINLMDEWIDEQRENKRKVKTWQGSITRN